MACYRRSAFAAILLGLVSGCVTQVSDAPKVPVPGPSPLSAEIQPNEAIYLNLPNGDVTIVAAPVDFAQLHLDAKCPSNDAKCRRRIQDMAWTTRRAGNRVVLELDGKATLNAQIVVNVRVPYRHPLHVNMKYGSLSIEDARQPVTVEMKAGDVDITMPESAVKRAFLRARFGDASLSIPENAISGRRPTLVGATVDWPHGRGRFPVSAKLRYGDVRLRLLE